MTIEEVAESLAASLRARGLVSNVYVGSKGPLVCAGTCDRDEEGVASVRGMSDNVATVDFCALRLGRAKALRGMRRLSHETADIEARCDAIAARFKEAAAQKAAQAVAWNVADKLKALGMPATATGGRVVITLDLSPEYAAEVGPKIAAVMAQRPQGG